MSKIDFYKTLQQIAGEEAAKEIAGKSADVVNSFNVQNNVKTAIQRNEMADKSVNPINTSMYQPSPFRSVSLRI